VGGSVTAKVSFGVGFSCGITAFH